MNASGYQSLNGDYGLCNDQDGTINMPTIPDYIQKLRLFIPPGTKSIYLVIYQYANCSGIVRMGKPPTNLKLPTVSSDIRVASFETILTQDMVISGSKGKLTIFNNAIPVVNQSQAGWLYVYLISSGQSSVYQNKAVLYVDKDIYNAWYSKINWARDVEGVTQYGTVPTPVPTPTPTPTPTPIPPQNTISVNVGVFGYWNYNTSTGVWTKP